MKTRLTGVLLLSVGWTLFCSGAPVPPIVTNLVAVQRPGTFLVDITYDLVDPDSQRILITVEASDDAGLNYFVPIGSLSGDVGRVQPGSGKRMVWNAWNDWAGNYTTNAKVRLTADDTLSLHPPPTNDVASNLLWIPPGAFDMSGTLVYISKGFYIGKYEVTQEEFVQYTNNPSYRIGATLPVNNLSWELAVEYCAYLTKREAAAGRLPSGWVYRLPTEAEWEYCWHAGTTNLYSFSDTYDNIGLYAWYAGNAANTYHEVGTRAPNRWGIHDMTGNVAELCSDWFGPLPVGNVTDPKGPPSGEARLLRGGSIADWPGVTTFTAGQRQQMYVGGNSLIAGIRVVLAPE